MNVRRILNGNVGQVGLPSLADYFALIESDQAGGATEITPRVRSLRGALAASGVDARDYRRHLEDEHR